MSKKLPSGGGVTWPATEGRKASASLIPLLPSAAATTTTDFLQHPNFNTPFLPSALCWPEREGGLRQFNEPFSSWTATSPSESKFYEVCSHRKAVNKVCFRAHC